MSTLIALWDRRARAIGAAALAIGMLAGPATAQPSHGRTHGAPPRPGWNGDIHRFPDRDWHVWRGGNWVHGPHDGRLGWWWVAGGLWYFYPAPVYPYPNPYEPPVVQLPQATLPPPTSYWYYCEASRTYYPYVASCPAGWQRVPASPAPEPSGVTRP